MICFKSLFILNFADNKYKNESSLHVSNRLDSSLNKQIKYPLKIYLISYSKDGDLNEQLQITQKDVNLSCQFHK